jgi:hypothetical protein
MPPRKTRGGSHRLASETAPGADVVGIPRSPQEETRSLLADAMS